MALWQKTEVFGESDFLPISIYVCELLASLAPNLSHMTHGKKYSRKPTITMLLTFQGQQPI
jgi:hypothetical protein